MRSPAEQFTARREQWARFAAWQRREDPTLHMSASEGFGWAGELHDWYVARFGYPQRPAQREDFAGVQLMRSRLSHLSSTA